MTNWIKETVGAIAGMFVVGLVARWPMLDAAGDLPDDRLLVLGVFSLLGAAGGWWVARRFWSSS